MRRAVRLAISTGILACTAAFGMGARAQSQTQAATRTQLAGEQDGRVLSLTAKVADVEGTPLSEGSVSFETPKGSLGSVFVQGGVAVLDLTNPPAWARTITAVYHGDATYADSSAATTVMPDASSLPGFTVTASPSSVTLTPGQFSTVELTVTSQNGFSEAVNLSCSGLPSVSNCSFNPVVATPPANGSVTSAMQLTTTAPSGLGSKNENPFDRSGTAYALVIPGLLALAGVGALRRKHDGALRMLGIVLLLGAASMGLTACNQRYSYEHYHPSPNYGTLPGNYTIVIAAYSSNGTNITEATSTDTNCNGATCIALTVQ
ncbi:MAG TPA: Ig-like domain-containing protein [Acidobacteriaceae bacterium]|nr:Ig-like domain-containing protein [Acidobacteriaceae bacterium]